MRTYVVRMLDEDGGDDLLRGIVRRVDDGSERPFHGSEQLIELLSGGSVGPERGD